MMEITTFFRRNLAELIGKSGYTITAFADKCDISREWLSAILNGRRNPSAERIERFAKELKVSIEDLFSQNGTYKNDAKDFSKTPPLIELEYLRGVIEALYKAYRALQKSYLSALPNQAPGKPDTTLFDARPEGIIRKHLHKLDPQSLFLSEEKAPDPQKLVYWSKRLYISDPFDRSTVFKKQIQKFLDSNPDKAYSRLADVVHDDDFTKPLRGLDAPVGSITCLHDNGIFLFTVALDYVSGMLYVAFRNTLKYGHIEDCFSPELLSRNGRNITFEPREGDNGICYLGDDVSDNSKKYHGLFSALGFKPGHKPQNKYSNPGGPLRPYHLSKQFSRAFKASNCLYVGEKISEWIGIFPIAFASKSLMIYELSDLSFHRDGFLMAPTEHYSILSKDAGASSGNPLGIRLNLERVLSQKNPCHYRGCFLLCHPGSDDISGMLSGWGNHRILYNPEH